MHMSTIDARQFRSALGQFATGVTIVTTFDDGGRPTGVTASSFNSVSLDPPLVLWSLAKSAQSLRAFQESGHFAVHVLGRHQQEMSNRFARSGEDKFSDLEFSRSRTGVPLFEGCAARFVCRTAYQYEGGDHVILVGEVVDFQTSDREPLLFHGGSYKEARQPVAATDTGETVDVDTGTYSEDFLSYLLARAHFQMSLPVARLRRDWGMSETEFLCLSLLSLTPGLTLAELRRRLEHTGRLPDASTLAGMAERGWITGSGSRDSDTRYQNTADGRALHVELLANSKLTDEAASAAFTPGELAEFRSYLRRLIERTDPGVPSLWRK
jgi:3-hydroxy-9,10-secoandrosta-1,3,5(10)-triene-9,17-dione monooxygenase reductase component